VLWSGVACLPLVAISRVFACFAVNSSLGIWAYRHIKLIAPFPYSGTLVGAVALSIPAALVAEAGTRWLFSRKQPRDVPSIRKIRELCSGMAGRFHRLLHELCGTGRPLCVCLADGKCYVGFVRETPTLRKTEDYFSIIPIKSGYRDPITKEILWRVDYRPLLNKIRIGDPSVRHFSEDDLSLLLPFKQVASGRVFDPDIGADHFKYL